MPVALLTRDSVLPPAPVASIVPLKVPVPTVMDTLFVLLLLVIVPLPVSEPMVWLLPFRSRVAPAATVTAVGLGMTRGTETIWMLSRNEVTSWTTVPTGERPTCRISACGFLL